MFQIENEIKDYFVDNNWVENTIDVEYLIQDSARFTDEMFPLQHPLRIADSIDYQLSRMPYFFKDLVTKDSYLLFVEVNAMNWKGRYSKRVNGSLYLMLFDTNKNQMVYGDYINVDCDTRNRETLYKVIEYTFRELVLFRFGEKGD